MNQDMAQPRQKVLFLITKATWGGAQRYVYDLMKGLPQNEFTPALAYGVEGRLTELCQQSGIRIRQIPALARDVALFSDIKSFFQIRDMLRGAQPAVLHLNSSKAAALGALAARTAHVPRIIFTVHGWPFKESRLFPVRSLIYLVSWLTALLCDTVIVVSRTDERIGRRMWGVGHKIVYIPLGIEAQNFRTPQEAFRLMFGSEEPARLDPQTLRLISLSELTKNKGLRYAIEAVALLRDRGIDAVYVIAGEGEARSALEKLARDRGVADRVFLVGFADQAAMNLPGFDIFILPSIKEGMPYVLLEAAAAGVPIVATSAIDAELLNEIDALKIVPTHSPLLLADAIQESAKRGRLEARNRFPLDEMLQPTLALYRA